MKELDEDKSGDRKIRRPPAMIPEELGEGGTQGEDGSVCLAQEKVPMGCRMLGEKRAAWHLFSETLLYVFSPLLNCEPLQGRA